MRIFPPLLLCLDYLLHFSIVEFACLYSSLEIAPVFIGEMVGIERLEVAGAKYFYVSD